MPTQPFSRTAREEGLPPRPDSPKLGDFSSIFSAVFGTSTASTTDEVTTTPKRDKPTKSKSKSKKTVRDVSGAENHPRAFSGGFLDGLNLACISTSDDTPSQSDITDADETDTANDTDATDATDTDDTKATSFSSATDSSPVTPKNPKECDNVITILQPTKRVCRKSPTKPKNASLYVDKPPSPRKLDKTAQLSAEVMLFMAQNGLAAQAQPSLQVPTYPEHQFIKPRYKSSPGEKLGILRRMLKEDFKTPKDRAADAVSSEPIHIFVDLSNITISFYNTVRAQHKIDESVKMSAPPFFFEAFDLVLERSREVARKVLAGSVNQNTSSTDRNSWPEYMRTAEKLGFEMNILTRVSKPGARPSSPPKSRRQVNGSNAGFGQQQQQRQLFYPVQPAYTHAIAVGSQIYVAPSTVYGLPYGLPLGGPTVPFPMHIPALNHSQIQNQNQNQAGTEATRRAEQGVDEILHLKMLQSVLDYEPATIVLATGDACEAEFSDGFLKNVERALKSGWRVELLTWSCGISSSWRKLRDDYKTSGRFRIIVLDKYAEEMLGLF